MHTGLLATACGDDNIRIFKEDPTVGDRHQPTFTLLETLNKAHSEDVNTVQWNPKVPGLLASGSDDGDVKLWLLKDS